MPSSSAPINREYPATSAARIRRDGGLAHTAQRGAVEQDSVLAVAVRQIARHDERGIGAQLCDDRTRFVEPPHMGIARCEIAVWVGGARIVLNGQEQIRRRFVKLAFEEIGQAHHG